MAHLTLLRTRICSNLISVAPERVVSDVRRHSFPVFPGRVPAKRLWRTQPCPSESPCVVANCLCWCRTITNSLARATQRLVGTPCRVVERRSLGMKIRVRTVCFSTLMARRLGATLRKWPYGHDIGPSSLHFAGHGHHRSLDAQS